MLLGFFCFSSLRSPLQLTVCHLQLQCSNSSHFNCFHSFPDTCQFCYVGWPSSTPLDCSPYKGDEDLAVECAAEGPALQIKWFHNLSMFNTSSVPLKNDTNFFIQSVYTSATNRVRSRLRVKNVTAGNYWCQVYHNNAGYPSSQILSISDANFYSRFEACTINSPQYEPLRTPKCYSLASQGTAACNNAGVLPTTTTAIVTTTTTRLTTTTSATPGVTTTSTTSGKVVTTDNSRSITRSSKLPTRTSYPSPSPQGSLRDVPEPYQTWLFVVVALTAVFGMLIIILTIVCIGICLLRSRSNEVDCEKGLSKDKCYMHPCIVNQHANVSIDILHVPLRHWQLPNTCSCNYSN